MMENMEVEKMKPKKKRQFFNGGRTTEFTEEHQSISGTSDHSDENFLQSYPSYSRYSVPSHDLGTLTTSQNNHQLPFVMQNHTDISNDYSHGNLRMPFEFIPNFGVRRVSRSCSQEYENSGFDSISYAQSLTPIFDGSSQGVRHFSSTSAFENDYFYMHANSYPYGALSVDSNAPSQSDHATTFSPQEVRMVDPGPSPTFRYDVNEHGYPYSGLETSSERAQPSPQMQLSSPCPNVSSPEDLRVCLDSSPTTNNEDTVEKGKRTRPQKCRMCFNHGIEVPVKGHKWFCPYRTCTCAECDITRNTQFYMKERQKLTRKQQQSQQNTPEGNTETIVPTVSKTGRDPMNYPRREELRRDTKDLMDDTQELFDKINIACRPNYNKKNHK